MRPCHLHFFQPLLVTLVIPWGLAGHCLPVQRRGTDNRSNERTLIKKCLVFIQTHVL